MKKENILKLIILLINIVVITRVSYLVIYKKTYYNKLYSKNMNKIIYSESSLRGRILDRNGKVLVDNIGIKSIIYTKIPGISIEEEITYAKKLANILDIKEDITDYNLKEYYLLCYDKEIDKLIDPIVKENFINRKMELEEYTQYKHSLISDKDLKKINKREATIFYYMNRGYSYQNKIIKTNITSKELTLVNEANIPGIRVDVLWQRIYKYDTCLNTIFGSVGNITAETKDEYLKNGYSLDDIVGISFLEKYYEEYLKGKKASYKINKDNTLTKISDSKRGNDLILGIDIDIQMKIENILKKEIKKAKKVPSTKYYNGSYIVLADPLDGSLISLVALKYDGKTFKSDVVGLLTNSYTVGSVVKGASHSVAYKYNVLSKKTKMTDSCVKLYSQKAKCSWKRLGTLNDITALKESSNYFQFINAIKVSGYKYKYNMKFNPTLKDFNKYRDVFKSYGLGVKTGIDLEEEKLGITGKTISGDLLLNLSIGQYDTYTPLMLSQYISTIANMEGRYKLRLATSIINDQGSRVEINKKELLNDIPISNEDLSRIRKGFKMVSTSGTGASYVNKEYDASSKTGTSETYYKGISTTTRSFVMYAPSDKPKYSLVIISPNINCKNVKNKYQYPLNNRLSRQITSILFEK